MPTGPFFIGVWPRTLKTFYRTEWGPPVQGESFRMDFGTRPESGSANSTDPRPVSTFITLAKSRREYKITRSFDCGIMDFMNLSPLLAFAPQTQPGQQPPPAWTSVVPLVLLIVVFYFILIRPQQKRAKQQAELLKSVKPGDKVVTSGGILAVVVTVKDKSVTIRSADSKMEISKGAITEILERAGEPSES